MNIPSAEQWLENKFKYRTRLAEFCHRLGLVELPVPPAEIFIETTNFCNLKCPMCPQTTGLNRPRGYMDFALYTRIIDEAKGRVPKVSLFLAGESLLHTRLYDMIQYARAAGMHTRLHTNAALLSRENAERLLATGLDELHFSFDGPEKTRHEAIRVGSVFETTLNNIYTFLDLKKQKGLALPRTTIEAIVFRNEDAAQIRSGMDALFLDKGYDEIKIIESHSWAGLNQNYIRNQERKADAYFPCSLVYDRMSVTWDGKVVGCCNDFQARYVCGDVAAEPLLKIWNNERYKNLRRMLVEKRAGNSELCKDCDNLWSGTKPYPFHKRAAARLALRLYSLLH